MATRGPVFLQEGFENKFLTMKMKIPFIQLLYAY